MIFKFPIWYGLKYFFYYLTYSAKHERRIWLDHPSQIEDTYHMSHFDILYSIFFKNILLHIYIFNII